MVSRYLKRFLLFLNSRNLAKDFTGKKRAGSRAHDNTVFSVISPTLNVIK